MNRQARQYQKIVTKHMSAKRLTPIIYKGFLQLNNKKTKNSNLEYGKKLNKPFTKKKIYKCPIISWKSPSIIRHQRSVY